MYDATAGLQQRSGICKHSETYHPTIKKTRERGGERFKSERATHTHTHTCGPIGDPLNVVAAVG